jgi:hypothetical protein
MTAAWRRFLLVPLIAGLAPAAFGCGYCMEDKIAAVYDYAVVTRAIAQKHLVVFFAVEGAIPSGEASRRKLQATVESAAGVDKGSVRVSVESASLSAAVDPLRASVAEMERSLSRKLARGGLTVALLRAMEKPAEPNAAGKR